MLGYVSNVFRSDNEITRISLMLRVTEFLFFNIYVLTPRNIFVKCSTGTGKGIQEKREKSCKRRVFPVELLRGDLINLSWRSD